MKVLVISHNVFSKTSNMGRTLSNFFDGWEKNSIAQLYFHTETPTIDVCTNYFRITDFDIIKHRKRNIGNIFKAEDLRSDLKSERVDEGVEAQIYQFGRKRKPYMYVGRNFLWSLKKWKNKKLLNWIDDFSPDLIFFASGDYVFSYKIAMEMAKYKNIPIVTYICDDYYFQKQKSISPLYYVNRYWYKNTLRKLLSEHNQIVTICDKITQDYSKEFKVQSKTIMTISTMEKFDEYPKNEKIRISYLGNLGYERHLQLVDIGKALKRLTAGKVFLEVYSAEIRHEILNVLNEDNGIKFCGAVQYEKVIEIMKNSDILVHTESFDKDIADKVRYSVSTKIADSLSCGRCLLAYGPSDVASIEYLKENSCACVVTRSECLETILKEIIDRADLREKYIKRAIEISKKNHNKKTNSKKIYEILKKQQRREYIEGNAN